MKTVYKVLIGIAAAAVAVIALLFGYKMYLNSSIKMEMDTETLSLEYNNGQFNFMDYVDAADNIEIVSSTPVDTRTLNQGKIEVEVRKKGLLGFTGKKKFEIPFEVTDNQPPVIELKQETITIDQDDYEDAANKAKRLLENIQTVSDPVDMDLTFAESGELTPGTYIIEMPEQDPENKGPFTVKVRAMDRNSRETEKEFQIKVEKLPYYIKVNRQTNRVMVYGLNSSGNDYKKKPDKCFICSTGDETPLGEFKIGYQKDWEAVLSSDGSENQFARYVSQIGDTAALFQSFPYHAQDPSTLIAEEYVQLGSDVDDSSVRLCVRDSKWIYENCEPGTHIEIYEGSDTESLTDFDPRGNIYYYQYASEDMQGWDPTDDHPNNPWNGNSNSDKETDDDTSTYTDTETNEEIDTETDTESGFEISYPENRG